MSLSITKVETPHGMLLELEEVTMSWHADTTNHYYKLKRDGQWFNLTNSNASKQTVEELLERFATGHRITETPSSVKWIEKYHVPKATTKEQF